MAGETRAPELIASVSVFLPLAIAAVAVRLWVRVRMIRNVGWDDGMMILALVNFAVHCSALMIIVGNGGGIRGAHLVNARLTIVWTLVAQVSYLTSILFLKLSLGLFFLRVVQVKWQRKLIYGIMVMSTVVQSCNVFFYVFSCGNPKRYPESMVTGKCLPRHVQVDVAYAQGAVTTLTDFLFALLPVPLLWNTTLDTRSKLSVAFALLLGTSGCICSIVRFKYIAGLGAIEDFFWTAANISMWSLYEIATGIIAGSIATMRPLITKVVVKVGAISQGRTRKDSHTNPQNSQARMLSTNKSYASVTRSRSQKDANDWNMAMDKSVYTTTCFAGANYEWAEALNDDGETGGLSKGAPSRKASSESSQGPSHDDQSIHKTVQIEVRYNQEEDQPWATAGGGTWQHRMENILRTPQRIRKGSRDDDDSIPEWDKLPDLITPNRNGSQELQKPCRNGERSPPLVSITTR